MKVKELIKDLKKLNQDALVVLSCDGEGNAYNNLSALQEGWYGDGQFYSNLEEAKDCSLEKKKVALVVALWPEG
jgi:hypothetical protein